MMEDVRGDKPLAIGVELERIYDFYYPVLERLFENPQPRKNDIEQLVMIA